MNIWEIILIALFVLKVCEAEKNHGEVIILNGGRKVVGIITLAFIMWKAGLWHNEKTEGVTMEEARLEISAVEVSRTTSHQKATLVYLGCDINKGISSLKLTCVGYDSMPKSLARHLAKQLNWNIVEEIAVPDKSES